MSSKSVSHAPVTDALNLSLMLSFGKVGFIKEDHIGLHISFTRNVSGWEIQAENALVFARKEGWG